jgi:hypothetical protein
VQQNRLGRAKSDWLTASDGWTEARFPQFVWKHVRPLLRVTPWMRLNLNGLNRLACPRKSAQRCCLQNEWICIARQHGEGSVSNFGRAQHLNPCLRSFENFAMKFSILIETRLGVKRKFDVHEFLVHFVAGALGGELLGLRLWARFDWRTACNDSKF